ncbi:MAG: rhodanese-like protein [Chloroflexi bacterium]|jgi:rhodanese-related sulfurtransferase|nr:rhodanese-like protein [Chloroflexota bacterium]
MENEPFTELEPEEAAAMIDEGTLKVIDVRQPYEFAASHIEGATLVPIDGLYSFAQSLAEQNLDKSLAVIFVCAVGQRSAAAAEVAAIAGFTSVYNLAGGMGNWAYAGLPVTRGF